MCAGVHSRGTLLTAGTTLEGEVPLTSAMPYFVELQNSVNVTGQLGAGAELHCKVNQPSKETAVRTFKICCFTFCVDYLKIDLYRTSTVGCKNPEYMQMNIFSSSLDC